MRRNSSTHPSKSRRLQSRTMCRSLKRRSGSQPESELVASRFSFMPEEPSVLNSQKRTSPVSSFTKAS